MHIRINLERPWKLGGRRRIAFHRAYFSHSLKESPRDMSIIFKGGLPSECACPICEQALREPIKLNCDHHMCKICYESPERSQNCPICQTIIQPELCQYDKEQHKQIQLLPVVCSFEPYGCQWQGMLKDLQEHLGSCEFKAQKCPNCQRAFSAQKLPIHMEKCTDQRTTCSFCSKIVRISDLERHVKSCPLVIISCPFQCGLTDRTRQEIEEHRPNCPNVENVCPFVPYGCTFAGDRAAIQKHLSDEPVRHLMLLCDEITDLKTTYGIMEKDMENFNERQHRILEKAETCNEMFGPQLVWKIDNIQQRTNEAKSGACTTIFSEPFMSHRHGYKMMACACLFGDGTSTGKALSLYVLILRGEYDATLEWPFSRIVKITLLDQNPNPEERVDITYVIDPRKLRANGQFLARPKGDRNAAFGSQSFCSLSILQSFIKDDSIYVKVDVDRCPTTEAVLAVRETQKMKTMEQLRNEETPIEIVRATSVSLSEV
ncbi:unnamed protein product [Caenorhabditis bovis]|uniref:RING-type E3 ubiquitin transferase n=1 Tax=Caenorhabditis bovis TaxID=2654633 RepID=A0A8S1EJR3_9PELO|nr:unnamed protein product [Caenorhabditis bovis]